MSNSPKSILEPLPSLSAKHIGNRKRVQKSQVSLAKNLNEQNRSKNLKNSISLAQMGHLYERQKYRVYLDGVDATPISLYPPSNLSFEPIGKINSFEAKNNIFDTQLFSESLIQIQSNFLTQSFDKLLSINDSRSYTSRQKSSRSRSEMNLISLIAPEINNSYLSDIKVSQQESEVFLKPTIIDESLPDRINIILNETKTMFLFEITSTVVKDGTDEANIVKQDNEIYEYLISSKGRNRKVLNQIVQSDEIVYKSRGCQTLPIKRRHEGVFVSAWVMYDEIKENEINLEMKLPSLAKNENIENNLSKNDEILKKIVENIQNEKDNHLFNQQLKEIGKNPRFLEAVLMCERVLDSNLYKYEQKEFLGYYKLNPLNLNVTFTYRLEHLCTFKNQDTFEKAVISIDWNKYNRTLLAVGYGKYFFNDESKGLICVWNIKNLTQPERVYKFNEPVTSIAFSRQHRTLLAVGFFNGSIKLVDCAYYDLTVIAHNDNELLTNYYPVWALKWVDELKDTSQYTKGTSPLFAVTENGKVSCYLASRGTIEMTAIELNRITKSQDLPGIKQLRKCEKQDLPLQVFATTVSICLVPYNPSLYLIATAQGTVHHCSKYHLNMHLHAFRAHTASINTIKYSPFCNKVFMTCSADSTIRIWVEDIFEPIITLNIPLQTIEFACWNKYMSTLIAAISQDKIYIWDLNKKTVNEPVNAINSPKGTLLTRIDFDRVDGRSLIVGDIEGNIIIYKLHDLPFVQHNQNYVLIQALRRALITRPELKKKLNKVDKLNVDSE